MFKKMDFLNNTMSIETNIKNWVTSIDYYQVGLHFIDSVHENRVPLSPVLTIFVCLLSLFFMYISKLKCDFRKKIKNIQEKLQCVEKIITADEYNTQKYLKYTGKDWTARKLRRVAIKNGIGENLQVKSTLARAIRISEQFYKIESIINPVYPEDDDTEEDDDISYLEKGNNTEDEGDDTEEDDDISYLERGDDTKDEGDDTKDEGNDTEDEGNDTEEEGNDTEDEGNDTEDDDDIPYLEKEKEKYKFEYADDPDWLSE